MTALSLRIASILVNPYLNLACSDLFEDSRKYTADSFALPDAAHVSLQAKYETRLDNAGN
jgi:hypothetical protein